MVVSCHVNSFSFLILVLMPLLLLIRLLATSSDGLHHSSDGLEPTSDGLEPVKHDMLRVASSRLQKRLTRHHLLPSVPLLTEG